jgi:hypothetical protein
MCCGMAVDGSVLHLVGLMRATVGPYILASLGICRVMVVFLFAPA